MAAIYAVTMHKAICLALCNFSKLVILTHRQIFGKIYTYTQHMCLFMDMGEQQKGYKMDEVLED